MQEATASEVASLRADHARLAAQLASAQQALEELAYHAAHQLRPPLRGAHGLVGVLREDFGSALPAPALNLLAQLGGQVDQASRRLEGLIQLARATTRPLRPVAVDVSTLAHEVIAALSRAPEARARWQVADGLTVWADPGALREILEEVCGNALRFSAGLTTADSVFSILGQEDEAGRCWICVRDPGSGFESRHAGKLFQPFQFLHEDPQPPGIGIGLALSARLIARHDGLVRLCPAIPRGAEFGFWLPGPPP